MAPKMVLAWTKKGYPMWIAEEPFWNHFFVGLEQIALPACLPVRMAARLSACPSACLHGCLPAYQPVCQPFHQPVCLSPCFCHVFYCVQ